MIIGKKHQSKVIRYAYVHVYTIYSIVNCCEFLSPNIVLSLFLFDKNVVFCKTKFNKNNMILINFMIVFGVLYIYIDMNLKCCKSIIYSSYVFYNSVSPNQLKTLSVNCDGPINALDTSKDNSQVVVAGRSGMYIGTYITTNSLSLTTFNMLQPKNKLNSMLHATQQLLNWRRKKRH